jgi:hypothetical protein
MNTEIITINDVKKFAYQIISEGVSFHPDDDFKDYIFFKEKGPCYTPEEAAKRNRLMEECFDLCEKNNVEIYAVMNIRENP